MRSDQKPSWIPAVAVAALLLLGSYIVGYYAMTFRKPGLHGWEPYYRLPGQAGDSVGPAASRRIHDWGGHLFAPMHSCDRSLRHRFWTTGCPREISPGVWRMD